MKITILVLLLALLPSLSYADPRNEIIDQLISKSYAVVSGIVIEQPICKAEEEGKCHYSLMFRVDEVLSTTKTQVQDIEVNIIIPTIYYEDAITTTLQKENRAILFLSTGPRVGLELFNTDYWFSVQPYNNSLAEYIRSYSRHKQQDKE